MSAIYRLVNWMMQLKYFIVLLAFCNNIEGNSVNPGIAAPTPQLQSFLHSALSLNRPANLAYAPQDLPISLTADPLVTADDMEKVAELSEAANAAVKKAQGVIRQLKETGAWLQNFIAGEQKKLPVGIKQNFGGTTVILALSEMRLKATHSEVDVYLQIEFPGVEDPLILGATDVEFSWRGGFGDLRLELLADYGINIAKKKSRLIFYKATGGTSTQPSNDGTYAIVTCGGVEEVNLKATLMMSRDWVVPVRNGEPLTNQVLAPGSGDDTPNVVPPDAPMSVHKNARVHWDFSLNIAGGNFLIETGSKDTFVINKYPDIHIYAEDIALDFSDTRNPSNITFPANYNSPFVTDGNALNLWRGVYIGGIAIQLPEKWRSDGAPPLVVYGAGLIIDDRGFTGLLGVQNLLPLSEGDAGGWPFSVDDLSFRFMQSQIEEVKFEGVINVPLLSKYAIAEDEDDEGELEVADCLLYTAHIEPASYYQFTATTQADYRIKMWKSQVVIDDGSSLDITYEDGDLTATAMLHGEIDVDVSVGANFSMQAQDITFANLELSSNGGLVYLGDWGFPTTLGGQIGAFFFTINDLKLEENATTLQPELSFGVLVEIGANETNLAAGGAFRIVGSYEVVDERQKFRYEAFKVDAFTIDMTTSSYGVAATIAIYRDNEVYGNGFYGAADLWFKALGGEGAGMAAVAQFGNVDGYKYFFIDCLARFGDAAPPIGTFSLLGAGGGVWVNMSLDREADDIIPEDANAQANNMKGDVQAQVQTGNPDALNAFIGNSISGQKLYPNQANLFGIKLTLVIGLIAPSPKAMSINGTFLMEVNEDNGFLAAIYGNATFFGDVNWNNELPESGLAAFFNIEYINDDAGSRFTATVDVFANIRGLKGKAVGGTEDPRMHDIAEAGYAGRIQLYAGPEGWYLNVGMPKIALGVNIGNVASVDVNAYFHLGNNIAPMPPPPDYVSELVGGGGNFMRNESLYATGNGVAFGAQLIVKANPDLLIFYVDILADFGFDINLQRYEGVTCLETGQNMGVNGWYAAGQAWAYLEGSVGMRFWIPFKTVELEVFHAELAALLQAKGPNPFWAGGRIAGRYRLLGGLIRGDFNMGFKVGQECTLVAAGGGDVMSNAQLISSLIPGDGSEEVATDADLLGLLNFQVGEYREVNGEQYRLNMENVNLSGPSGPIEGWERTTYGEMLTSFKPREMLPANTTLTFTVTVNMQKGFNASNVVNTETKSVTFTTGDALAVIPLSNVEVSYPLDGMYNFYEDESDEGAIKLVLGQPEVFEQSVYALFVPSDGIVVSRSVTYSVENRRATFSIPSLLNDEVYQLALVVSDGAPGGTGNPGNPSAPGNQQQQTPGGGFDGGGPSSPTPPLENTTVAYDTLLTIYFRTSEYRTLEEKVNDLIADHTFSNFFELQKILASDDERFGNLELEGNDRVAPMIQLEARKDFPWYQDHAFDQNLYNNLPLRFDGETVANVWRLEEFGRVPTKAITIATGDDNRLITASNWQSGTANASASRDTFKFLFPQTVIQDVNGYYNALDALLEPYAQQILLFIEDETLWDVYMFDGFEAAGGNLGDPSNPSEPGDPPNWDLAEIKNRILRWCPEECNPDRDAIYNTCPNFNFSLPCENDLRDWFYEFWTWENGTESNPRNNLLAYRNQTFPIRVKYKIPGMGTGTNITINVSTPNGGPGGG